MSYDARGADQIPENAQVMSVSSYLQITNRALMDFGTAYVEGEIAELKSYRHLYFKLKDENGSIDCLMWSNQVSKLSFTPREGDKVIAAGTNSLYPKTGQFKLICHALKNSGLGEILERLNRLKDALEREGVFAGPKRPIPRFVNTVGIITSAEGKAVHDIVTTLNERNNGIAIIIYDARVQGREAPSSLLAALHQANSEKRADILIIGRGGGSFEDLLAFSDENLVRAVSRSEIPIISAVGHEPDVALTDFAADARAATPSTAAALVSAVTKENLWREISGLRERLDHAVDRYLDYYERECGSRWQRLKLAGPEHTLELARDRLSGAIKAGGRVLSFTLKQKRMQYRMLEKRLIRRDPEYLIAQQREHLGDLGGRLTHGMLRVLELAALSLSFLARRLEVSSPGQVTENAGNRLQGKIADLERGLAQTLDLKSQKLRDAVIRLSRLDPAGRLRDCADSLDLVRRRGSASLSAAFSTSDKRLRGLVLRLNAAGCGSRVEEYARRLDRGAARLRTLDPLAQLARGYTLTVDGSGQPLSLDHLAAGDEILTLSGQGKIYSTVRRIERDS